MSRNTRLTWLERLWFGAGSSGLLLVGLVYLDAALASRSALAAFVAAHEAPEEVHVHEAAPVAALPTTASPIPALALMSGLFVAAAGVVRVLRRKA